MDNRSRPIVGRIVTAAAGSERRRLLVVLGVPVLFAALIDLTANFGVGILFVAAGLAAFLYTRPTAQETVAAACYGAGTVLIGLFLLELYLNGAQGSTEPLLGTATRVLWRAVMGASLIGLGLWLRRIEL